LAAEAADLSDRSVGGLPCPFSSQSIETPSAVAIALIVLADGFGSGLVSIIVVCPRFSPAMRSNSLAETPATVRAHRSLADNVSSTMTVIVAETVLVVNRRVMTPPRLLPYACGVATKTVTLRDRLRAVKEMIVERGDTVGAWTKRAGMSRQSVDQYILNKEKEKKGKDREISYENVLRLADAAEVDRAWLLIGVDTMPRLVAAGPTERVASLQREIDSLSPPIIRVVHSPTDVPPVHAAERQADRSDMARIRELAAPKLLKKGARMLSASGAPTEAELSEDMSREDTGRGRRARGAAGKRHPRKR
jgi:hypothetical protein